MGADLIQELVDLWGPEKFFKDYPIGHQSFMKTGGSVDALFRPRSLQEMSDFLKKMQKNREFLKKITILGAMSNILVRDGGLRGCAVDLRNAFDHKNPIQWQGMQMICPAGLSNFMACTVAAQAGFSGLEFLIGIPGSIGGASFMNAGAQGSEVMDRLAWIEGLDEEGNVHRLVRSELPASYRYGGIPSGLCIFKTCFNLTPSQTMDGVALQKKYLEERKAKITIPSTFGCAGSAFKNPMGKSAWKLIDEAGGRGMRLGGAMFSERHANFLLNTGQATAAEIEDLGEKIRDLVYQKTGELLEWEIKIIGERYE